ncbi:MAG: YcxB family protein [Verrucomicrobiota bacterium]
MVEFEFLFSDEFLVEMFRIYRRSRPWALWWLVLKVVLAVVLLGLMVLLIAHCAFLPALGAIAVLGIFFAVLLFAQRIDEWLMVRRFRKSPFRNKRVHIHLSTEGFTSKWDTGETRLDWAVFTSARRFLDGFLLFQGPGVFNWLPFERITFGSITEVDELIRAKIQDFKSV